MTKNDFIATTAARLYAHGHAIGDGAVRVYEDMAEAIDAAVSLAHVVDAHGYAPWQPAPDILKTVDVAVAIERERCARLLANLINDFGGPVDRLHDLKDAIRTGALA